MKKFIFLIISLMLIHSSLAQITSVSYVQNAPGDDVIHTLRFTASSNWDESTLWDKTIPGTLESYLYTRGEKIKDPLSPSINYCVWKQTAESGDLDATCTVSYDSSTYFNFQIMVESVSQVPAYNGGSGPGCWDYTLGTYCSRGDRLSPCWNSNCCEDLCCLHSATAEIFCYKRAFTASSEFTVTLDTNQMDSDKDGYINVSLPGVTRDCIDTNADCDARYPIDRLPTANANCKANRGNIHIGATEVCDGVDNNCNGIVDTDAIGGNRCEVTPIYCDDDFDGDYSMISKTCATHDCANNCESCFHTPTQCVEPSSTAGTDCNDNNPNVYQSPQPPPSPYYDCVPDAIDFNDDDLDYYLNLSSTGSIHGDCDDNDNTVYPGAPEVLDNKDNDCDGLIDNTGQSFGWTFTSGSDCTLGNGFVICGSGGTIYQIVTIIGADSLLRDNLYNFQYEGNGVTPNITTSEGDDITPNSMSSGEVRTIDLENVVANLTLNISFEIASGGQLDFVKFYLKELTQNSYDVFVSDDDSIFDTVTSCCPNEFCWNGTECMYYETYLHSGEPPLFKQMNESGYRCIYDITPDGNETAFWTYVEPKEDPYQNRKGYCRYDDMCFVTSDKNEIYQDYEYLGSYNGIDPMFYGCAPNGGFFTAGGSEGEGSQYGISKSSLKDINDEVFDLMDFYCLEGNWTSRTKLVALQLLNMTQQGELAGHDFMLYCDRPVYTNVGAPLRKEGNRPNLNVVNFMDLFGTGWGSEKIKIFDNTKPSALFNNFCVLIVDTSSDNSVSEPFGKDDFIAIGSSINYYLDEKVDGIPVAHKRSPSDPVTIFNTFFGQECDPDSMNTDRYTKCTPSNVLWFNNKSWTFIYSKDDLTPYLGFNQESFLQKLSNYLVSLWDKLVGFIIDDSPLEYIEDNSWYINENIDVYNRIFVSNVNGVVIEGVNQRKKLDYQDNLNADVAYIRLNESLGLCEYTAVGYVLNISTKGQEFLKNYAYAECNNENGYTHISLVGGRNNDEELKNTIDEVWYALTGQLRPR